MITLKSRYRSPKTSNVEVYLGRKLGVQDNCWLLAKIFSVALIWFVSYLIANGDLGLSGIKDLLKCLR